MMICVTNRKLCRGDFLERIEQLAAGGADAILLREKDLSVPEYAALAKQCLAICQAYHTPLWLNSFPKSPDIATAGTRFTHSAYSY